MLLDLEVRDLGIIDVLRLQLPGGFIVLTGETGAGKSLLVQSLQLLGGERAQGDQVRGGANRLLVEGCFKRPRGRQASELLDELGVADGAELVVRREVTAQGRSRAWLNDVPVTVGALTRLAPFLLAVHGQHEQRGLADPSTHLGLVDAAGGLVQSREEVAQAFAEWQGIRARLGEQRRALAGRRDRLDVITFQLREIDEAHVTHEEDVALREERTLLRHGERIGELLTTSQAALGGEGGAVSLARASRAVRELANLGLALREVAEQLEQAQLLTEEAEREVRALASRVRADPARLEVVESRLALLERLARKYGGDLAAVVDHRAALQAEREELERVDDDIARLEEEETRAVRRYLDLARGLSRRRGKAAPRLCREVVAVLERLAMKGVRLELPLSLRESRDDGVEVSGARVEPAADGLDVGELLVSANPGEEVRPLTRIASGGELSRIHLAIRTVLRDLLPDREALTLLFDEVDAGIGGRVADELGVLLAELGQRDQVLVVTHLPQVACRAAMHFVVRKEAADGRTVTRVAAVDGEVRVDEMVRMLGGVDTQTARQHARALLRPP